MGQLNNQYVSSSYQGLLKMTDSTTGVTGTLQVVQTGDGTDTPLQISKTEVNISGSFTVNGSPITGSAVDTGSFATTGSNTFIGSQIIQGNVSFPSNSFVSTDNVSGALYFSSLNGGTLYLNADGGEGDVVIGHAGWNNNIIVKGNTIQTGSIDITGDYLINGVPISGGSGTSGTSGSSGTDGTSGSSGTDGTSGSSGTDGTSGSSGTDGTSGSNGTDGSSGTSGGSIDTGSFATTGSNTFYGYQNVNVPSGQDSVSLSIISGSGGVHQLSMSVSQNGQLGLTFAHKGNNFFQTNGNLTINNNIGGDGTGSISINVNTGSFNVTSPKVKINDGNITITGSLNVIGNINSTSVVNNIIGRTMIYGGTGGGSGATPRLFISGSDGAFTSIGRSFFNVDTTMASGITAGQQYYGAPNTQPYINIGVYTPDTFEDDYELSIYVSTGGTHFQDWDNFNAFEYEDFLVIPPNVGNSPAPQFTRGLGVTGSLKVTGGITGSLQGSASFATNFNKTGLITTGSVAGTLVQNITGSLKINTTGTNYSIETNENGVASTWAFGQAIFTPNGMNVTDATNNKYSSVSQAGVQLGFNDTFEIMGLTNDSAADYVEGWTGFSLYATDTTDTFQALLGFQNKTTWTNGQITSLVPLVISGSLNVKGDVKFASGSNKTMGTVALNGSNPGTATISNTLVTTSSLIFLTKQTNNHPNAGPVVVSSKGSSTFTITSNHNGDTDVVAYQIINPA